MFYQANINCFVNCLTVFGVYPNDDARRWNILGFSLQWRHNALEGVSNHQPYHCLISRLLGRRSKKTSKLHVTGLVRGIYRGPVNSPHKWPVTWKMFPFDDIIMCCHWWHRRIVHITRNPLGYTEWMWSIRDEYKLLILAKQTKDASMFHELHCTSHLYWITVFPRKKRKCFRSGNRGTDETEDAWTLMTYNIGAGMISGWWLVTVVSFHDTNMSLWMHEGRFTDIQLWMPVAVQQHRDPFY